MDNEGITIIQDTITVYDTIKSQIVEEVLFSEEVNHLVEKSLESDSISKYIIPGLGVIIAFWALIVSYRALRINQTHNHLSVEPLLIFRPSTSHRKGKISLIIYNKGIGPLTFKSFNIVYDGQNYTRISRVYKIIREKFNYTDDDFVLDERLFTLPLKGYSLTSNEKKILIRYKLKDKNEKTSRLFYEEFKKIKFEYTFENLYKTVTSDSFEFSEYY
jgi:hypothetical protein